MDMGREVARYVRRGWRVETAGDSYAVLARGGDQTTGAVLIHVVLTVLTVGLWLPVWALTVWTRRLRRIVLRIDTNGRVVRVRR